MDAIFEIGKITVAVREIFVHSDYEYSVSIVEADIAVLVLDNEVHFTDRIQPICLINPDDRVEEILNAVVIGHGRNEYESTEKEKVLRVAESPIRTNKECYSRFEDLLKHASYRTMCAGKMNATSCLGDSGGGLIISQNNVFYLRGIVSAGPKKGEYGCDTNSYSFYTNMLMFNDWIESLDAGKYLDYFDHMKKPR